MHADTTIELRKRLEECEASLARKGLIQTNEGRTMLLHLVRTLETLIAGYASTPMPKTHHE